MRVRIWHLSASQAGLSKRYFSTSSEKCKLQVAPTYSYSVFDREKRRRGREKQQKLSFVDLLPPPMQPMTAPAHSPCCPWSTLCHVHMRAFACHIFSRRRSGARTRVRFDFSGHDTAKKRFHRRGFLTSSAFSPTVPSPRAILRLFGHSSGWNIPKEKARRQDRSCVAPPHGTNK